MDTKKIIVVTALALLAASCNQSGNQNQSSNNQNNQTAKIASISIEPSYKDGNWTMYSNGAVVRIVANNMVSMEIKYLPTGTNQSEQSLGQATSLSSQQNVWALQLPASLMAIGFWAEGTDTQGNVVKSQDLGNVRHETLNSYKSPAKYAFSINYLGDFGFNTDYNKVKALSYIPACDEKMVACVFLSKDKYPGTNFDAAGVSINIDSALNTESKCYNFAVSTNEAQTPAGDVEINGVMFKSATGGGGAAGHFSRVQVYRNFHNSKCYEIARTIAGSNIGNYEPGTVQQFDENEILRKLQFVVSSFTFTDKAAATPPQSITNPGKQITVTGTIVCLPKKEY